MYYCLNVVAYIVSFMFFSKNRNSNQTYRFPTQYPTYAVVETPTIGDGGLFSEKPCASPCFFGVQIGETSIVGVVDILWGNGIFPCIQDFDKVFCEMSINIGTHSSTKIVNSMGFSPITPIF